MFILGSYLKSLQVTFVGTHQIKTIEILLTLAEVVSNPSYQPMSYKQLVDAIIDRGSSTKYHAIYRILNNERLMRLLEVEKIKQGRGHLIRYKTEKFAHRELVANLIQNHLNNLLPKDIRSPLLTYLKSDIEKFEGFNEYMRDKHWLKKLVIEPDMLGHWCEMSLSPEIEKILSALYRNLHLSMRYQLEVGAPLQEEKIMPVRVEVCSLSSMLFYQTRESQKEGQSQRKGSLERSISLNCIKEVWRS